MPEFALCRVFDLDLVNPMISDSIDNDCSDESLIPLQPSHIVKLIHANRWIGMENF
jgi:hypothetical protein